METDEVGVYDVVVTKKYKPCGRCCDRRKPKETSRGQGTEKGGTCRKWTNLFRRLAKASSWIYRHPMVRLFSMSAVLFLNVLLFSEDPQSYSNSDVSIPFVGQVFNFCTSGYPSAQTSPRWLALKCLLLVLSFAIGTLVGEFLLRRLVLRTIFGFRGFKKNKGVLVCAFICVGTGLWMSAQLYVIMATARNSHALSFMNDWNASDFKSEVPTGTEKPNEDLDADGQCDFEGPLIYDESSFAWKNMDEDVRRTIPSSRIPLSNGAFAMVAFYITVLGDLYALFSIFDYVLQDRKNYVGFCLCAKAPQGCWGVARIPIFWCFAILCVSFVGTHFAFSGFVTKGSMYWQGSSVVDNIHSTPNDDQSHKLVGVAAGNENIVVDLVYSCAQRYFNNESQNETPCKIKIDGTFNRSWYAERFHAIAEKPQSIQSEICCKSSLEFNETMVCENAPILNPPETELFRFPQDADLSSEKVNPCVAAQKIAGPSRFLLDWARAVSIDSLHPLSSLWETKADSPAGRALLGLDELQRVYLAAIIFVLNLLVFTQDPEFSKIDVKIGVRPNASLENENDDDDSPFIPGLAARSLNFPNPGGLKNCFSKLAPCCKKYWTNKSQTDLRKCVEDGRELVVLSGNEDFYDRIEWSSDELSSPAGDDESVDAQEVSNDLRPHGANKKPNKNKYPLLTAKWLTYSVLIAVTVLDGVNLYSQASYFPADFEQIVDEKGFIHSKVLDVVDFSGYDNFRFHVLEHSCAYSVEGGCVTPLCFSDNPDGRARATEGRETSPPPAWLEYMGLESDLPKVEHHVVIGATGVSGLEFRNAIKGFVVGPGNARLFYEAEPGSVRGFGKKHEHNPNDRKNHGFFENAKKCSFGDYPPVKGNSTKNPPAEFKTNVFEGFGADAERLNQPSLVLGQIRWTDYRNASRSDRLPYHEFRGWKCACYKAFSADFQPFRSVSGRTFRNLPNADRLGSFRDGTVGRCFFGNFDELGKKLGKETRQNILDLFIVDGKKMQTTCDAVEYYEMTLDEDEKNSLLRSISLGVSSSSNNGTDFNNSTSEMAGTDILDAINAAVWVRPISNASEYPAHELDYRCLGCYDRRNRLNSRSKSARTRWSTLRYFGAAGVKNLPEKGSNSKVFYFSDACVDAEQLASSFARSSSQECKSFAEEALRKGDADASVLPKIRSLEISCEVTSGKLNSRYAGKPSSEKALPLTISAMILACVTIRIAIHNALESLLKWNNKRRVAQIAIEADVSSTDDKARRRDALLKKETPAVRKIKTGILRGLMCVCCKHRKKQYEIY